MPNATELSTCPTPQASVTARVFLSDQSLARDIATNGM
jgi:hypothetical protein